MTTETASPWPPHRKPRRTVAELIAEKHAKPVEITDKWQIDGVFDSDEEVDEFNATVREWRDASLA